MKISYLLFILILISGCESLTGDQGIRGEQGIKGEKGDTGQHGDQGEPGKDLKFTQIIGYLAPGEPEYWIFETGIALERCIISVHVSIDDFNPTAWLEPSWIFVLDTISIYNDDLANSGDRYVIIIASEKEF